MVSFGKKTRYLILLEEPTDPLRGISIYSYTLESVLTNIQDSVLGSGTGPLDSESRYSVPDLEAQILKVRYRTLSQPYEDCLGVGEYIVSYYTAVIFGLLSFRYHAVFYLLF